MSEVALRAVQEPAEDPVYEGLRGEARKQAIVELIGEPDRSADVQAFVDALRSETARYWTRYIEPLIDQHWPEVRSTPFYTKFKIGAQKVYAPAPYTVAVLSRRRPFALRFLLGACRLLRLPGAAIAWGMKLLLPFYTRWFMRVENRRIALMAAFIASADEAFDHHLNHVPADERSGLLRRILEGRAEPPTPSLRLVQALRRAMDEGCDADELAEIKTATEGCCRWGEAEVKRALREPDPEGLCHRGAGIRGGIDGLAWTARGYVSDAELHWMYDVSYFVQMVDDWVDLEKDLDEDVWTPVADGTWTLDTVRQWFDRTTETVVGIARDNGEDYPPYLRLVGEGYRHQVRDLLQDMVKGIAD